MLLRNCYNILKARLKDSGSSSGLKVSYINTDGASENGTMYMGGIQPTNVPQTSANIFILQLGTGDTLPTKSDYKLENPIDNALFSNQTVTSNVYTDATNDHIAIASHGVCNASEEPIVVREIGILLRNCLITRTVLDEPVTIQPGEYYTFTETIEIP